MRVFHGPTNVAGAAGVLAAAQRELGVDATSVCFDSGHFEFGADQVLPLGVRSEAKLLSLARSFDVFHFYFGQSLTVSHLWDIPLLKRMGKAVFFYFCGCDIRDSKMVIQNHALSACAECWPMSCSPNRAKALEMAELADGVFVSTPDLLEFVPQATVLPQPIDADRLARLKELRGPSGRSAGDPLRIAHAPSNRSIKGTSHVERSVAELIDAGRRIELVLVEGQTYEASLQTYRSCDLAIDQLLIGAYGQFAVEMMAMGKPVVCHLRDDVRDAYDDSLPIVAADPSTLTEVLADLVSRQDDFDEIGRQGAAYVERFHRADVVAAQALEAYREAWIA